MIKKVIKKLKKVFIPKSEFIEEEPKKVEKPREQYIGVVAPVVTPFDSWFSKPVKTEKVADFCKPHSNTGQQCRHQDCTAGTSSTPQQCHYQPSPHAHSAQTQRGPWWHSSRATRRVFRCPAIPSHLHTQYVNTLAHATIRIAGYLCSQLC